MFQVLIYRLITNIRYIFTPKYEIDNGAGVGINFKTITNSSTNSKVER